MRAIAEQLHIFDGRDGSERFDGRTHPRRLDFDQGAGQRGLQPGWFVEGHYPSFVQEGDPRAALRFVEVWRGHHDGQAAREEFGQEFPELTPRHRIDTGRRLVEQQHIRPVNECAREREFLLHAAR
jgi:hypothetical protein